MAVEVGRCWGRFWRVAFDSKREKRERETRGVVVTHNKPEMGRARDWRWEQ